METMIRALGPLSPMILEMALHPTKKRRPRPAKKRRYTGG